MSGLPAWANDYVGVPWAERGRDRSGWDCLGLVLAVGREVFGWDLDLPDLSGHGFVRDMDLDAKRALAVEIMDELAARCERVARTKARPGDVILLRVAGHPIHMGVMVAPGDMLHCLQGAQTVVEPYDGLRWGRRVEGFYRVRS